MTVCLLGCLFLICLSIYKSVNMSACCLLNLSIVLSVCLLFYIYVGLPNSSVGQVVCLSAFCQSV